MAKARNIYETMARSAARRLEAAQEVGEQLTFLPDEAGAPPVDTLERKASGGRPPGAKGKAASQLRKMLAERGWKLPEDVLGDLAGLTSRVDAIEGAMVRAEQVLAWAFEGNPAGKQPSPEQRLATFAQVLSVQLRAAEALLPYGLAKASPDVNVTQQTTVVVPCAPAAPVDPAAAARPAGGSASLRAGRMVPADVAEEIEGNQGFAGGASARSDAESRTDGENDGTSGS